jgi:hypothetical protein
VQAGRLQSRCRVDASHRRSKASVGPAAEAMMTC